MNKIKLNHNLSEICDICLYLLEFISVIPFIRLKQNFTITFNILKVIPYLLYVIVNPSIPNKPN